VRGEALGLLESYLRDRSQYVVYHGWESGRHGVECGVPQGSVLRPLFFLLYVNNMARATGELGFVLFADDTNLFAEGQYPAGLFETVNGGLHELGRWFRCDRLTLNLKKTEYVYFTGTRPPEVPTGGLVIDGEQVRRVEGSKFPGVWVDAELKWRGHIDQVGGKMRWLLGVLGRARADLDEPLLISLYNSMVLPHL
jgi:ribonuclease P/MRP protein subunit RPP40